MSPREYSEARLQSVLDEIAKLQESDFPYSHSREALNLLRTDYETHLSKITALPSSKDPTIVNGLCSEALFDIFQGLPLLGFILRSTNVRNAFEVHGPILTLCQQILGSSIKLILSSEWEFSPFILPEQQLLPDFVLIGLPASETNNPLLLPLAGHELGHTIWRLKDFETRHYYAAETNVFLAIEANISEYKRFYPNDQVKVGDTVAQLDANMFVKRTIAPVITMALQRAQECFCDCVGVYLFDEAFLHAYAYLASPSIACDRPWEYPNNLDRVDNLINAAKHYQKSEKDLYKIPKGYRQMFEDFPEAGDVEEQYLSRLADSACRALCSTLISDAETLLRTAGAPQLEPETRRFVVNEFRYGVPAANAKSLTNVLNAGWVVYNRPDFWPTISDPKRRKQVLANLVIKNIELLEIERRNP